MELLKQAIERAHQERQTSQSSVQRSQAAFEIDALSSTGVSADLQGRTPIGRNLLDISRRRAIALGGGQTTSDPATQMTDGLRTRLMRQLSLSELGCVAFAGTAAADGVTTVSSGFANGLAVRMGLRVILLQANVGGRPAARDGAADSGVCLGDLLRGAAGAEGAIEPKPGVLRIVPPGDLGHSFPALLQAGAFAELIVKLRAEFDCIILDCPPLPQHAETLMMAREADGVVVVMRAGRTRKRVAAAATRMLEQSDARILGTVLNRRRYHIPGWLYRWL